MTIKDLLLPACLTLLIASGSIVIYRMAFRSAKNPRGSKACELKTNMRKLWTDHAIWTQKYIISSLSNAPGMKYTRDRLNKNVLDLGDILGEYYGANKASEFSVLLQDHVSFLADMIDAIKLKDKEKISETNSRWQNNSEKIAKFLNQINNNFATNDLLNQLKELLRLSTEIITAYGNNKFENQIIIFDQTLDQTIKIADALTNGIAKQFTGKF